MKKDVFDRMIDAILLGSSSERIQGTNLYLILHSVSHHVFLAMFPSLLPSLTISFIIDISFLHAEHIHMFSHTYTQAQLQDCLYTLYNGEISCVQEWFIVQERFTKIELKRFMWFNSQAKRTKMELKRFNAYAKSYLLDTLELNVKSRCTYNWSGK